MNQPSEHRWDVRMRGHDLAVLSMLAVLAGAGLMIHGAGRRNWPISPEPADKSRVQQAFEKIDPNTASVASLRRLPRIGQTLAGRIVEGRKQSPYRSADDLRRVPRIGPAAIEMIAPYLDLPAAASQPTTMGD